MFDDLADLDRRIAGALDELRGARARVSSCPSGESRWQEALAERTLDQLLDRRPHWQMRHQARLLSG